MRARLLVLLLALASPALAGCVLPEPPPFVAPAEHVSSAHPVPRPPPRPMLEPLRVLDPDVHRVTLELPPAAPRDVLYNGGVEEGDGEHAAGWMLHGGARREENASRTGEHGLRLGAGSNASQMMGGATPGASAHVVLHARTSEAAHLRAALLALDAQQQVVASEAAEIMLGTSDWAEVALPPLLLSAETAHLQLVLEAEGVGAVDVDDARLELVPAPATSFVNGGFEERARGWALEEQASVDCRLAHRGCSLRLGHEEQGIAQQRFSAGGASVTLTFMKITDAWPLAEPALYVNWTFYDADGAVLDRASGGGVQRERGWVEAHEGPVAVPPGTTHVALELATNPAIRGATWVDEMRVEWS